MGTLFLKRHTANDLSHASCKLLGMAVLFSQTVEPPLWSRLKLIGHNKHQSSKDINGPLMMNVTDFSDHLTVNLVPA